jgi:N-acetylmuramoyl-L-alanine amidase
MTSRRPATAHRRSALRRSTRVLAALAAATAAAACSTSGTPARIAAPIPTAPGTTAPRTTATRATSPAPVTRAPAPHKHKKHAARRPSTPTSTPTPAPTHDPHAVASTGGRPVIVIDPGHSLPVSATDPRTGLDVSDYENEPEMRDVFAVAKLVQARLEQDGYRVVMTKTRARQRMSLGARAALADRFHADLALSIHDQAGSNGGIGFDSGNNIVYYQSVGDYRTNASGTKIYFTDSHVAALSRKYGRIFRTQRQRVEGHPITLLGNAGYNLGSRGLSAGDIWMVQLLSHVPWIYNESGGNSAGRSGLNSADEHTYADALVAGVEHCIPPPR